MQLKLMNVPAENWVRAAHLGNKYKDHIVHTGIRHGLGFEDPTGEYYYIYKTKTQIVVRCV